MLVRDHVPPARFLGHSDSTDRSKEAVGVGDGPATNTGETDAAVTVDDISIELTLLHYTVSISVAVTYGTGSR
jgi:hypothetical protein